MPDSNLMLSRTNWQFLLIYLQAKWLGSDCKTDASRCCPCSDYIGGTGVVDCADPDNDGDGTCECRSGSMQTGTHTCKLSE